MTATHRLQGGLPGEVGKALSRRHMFLLKRGIRPKKVEPDSSKDPSILAPEAGEVKTWRDVRAPLNVSPPDLEDVPAHVPVVKQYRSIVLTII